MLHTHKLRWQAGRKHVGSCKNVFWPTFVPFLFNSVLALLSFQWSHMHWCISMLGTSWRRKWREEGDIIVMLIMDIICWKIIVHRQHSSCFYIYYLLESLQPYEEEYYSICCIDEVSKVKIKPFSSLVWPRPSESKVYMQVGKAWCEHCEESIEKY